MTEQKPLTLQEFFQALADGKTEFFDIEAGKITYVRDHPERGCRPFIYHDRDRPGVFYNDMVRLVANRCISLYEKPKRLLTPDDVGKIAKDKIGCIGVISFYNPDSKTFDYGIASFESDGKSAVRLEYDTYDITHIRNDDGTWEEIG